MTFFALIGFEEVVKAVSESRSSADRWIRSIFCIPYKMLKSQNYEYDNYNSYHLGFDGLVGINREKAAWIRNQKRELNPSSCKSKSS